MKKFLFSTFLTATVAASMVASADTTVIKGHAKAAHKSSHHAKKHHKKLKDDAYSPHKSHGVHQHHHSNHNSAGPIAYASAPTHLNTKNQSHGALINPDGLSVKVGGKVDIQYGSTDQQPEFKIAANNGNLPEMDDLGKVTVDVTQNAKYTNSHAATSNGELLFTAEKEMHGRKYGAKIKVNANTSPTSSGNSNVSNTVFLFIENHIGRFEAGAVDGPSELMAISGASIAKATGGIDGNYSTWIPYKALTKPDATTNKSMTLDNIFLSSPSLPFDAKSSKRANKLSYYTPTFQGFKGGLAYVRDSTVQGTTYEALDFKGTGYKNVVEFGLSYEKKINHMNLAFAATGKTGQARDAYSSTTPITLNRLSAWQVGGKVAYGPFTVATSYGDWGKSGTAAPAKATTPKRKQNFWTAGLAFNHFKGGASLTYMNSNRRGAFSLDALPFITANQDAYDSAKNKFKSVVLGVEYKLMPGLMPYAEIASFKYQSPLADQKLMLVNKGTIVLGGVKLNF